MSNSKNLVEKIAVNAGKGVGSAAGGAIVAAGAANIAAASAATAASAAAATTAVAATPLASTSIFASFYVAGHTAVANPATWALLATNPVGHAVLIGGGAAIGAIAAYKLIKKLI